MSGLCFDKPLFSRAQTASPASLQEADRLQRQTERLERLAGYSEAMGSLYQAACKRQAVSVADCLDRRERQTS